MSKKTVFTVFIWLTLAGTASLVSILAGMYLYLSPQLPSVNSLNEIQLQTPMRIYSADNKLMGEFGKKRRTPIRYEDIPQDFINALLTAEDTSFYEHNGVSIKGLMRAVKQLITTGKKRSGGSTITMQVARNVYLTRKKAFTRKFNEILLSLRIEKELSKEKILELYSNYMFMGKRAYGIQAAAQVYYGKPIQELSTAQMAMIAGLFQGPSKQNPIINPKRAMKRRNWILNRMHELNFIDDKILDQSLNEPIIAENHGANLELEASYAAEMARREAVALFGEDIYEKGYKIYTTVQSSLQQKAQSALKKGLYDYDQRHGYRGPVTKLESKDLPDLSVDGAYASLQDNATIKSWLKSLAKLPIYGSLEPVAIIEIKDNVIKALRKNGDIAFIHWEKNVSKQRLYKTENVLGSAIKTPQDIVDIGDVISIQPMRQTKSKKNKKGKKTKEGTQWLFSQIPEAQAALVSMNTNNGAIVSIVGGFDFTHSKYNRATQASRQPGSNFKPFIYTSALENGMTPATIINDAPIVFEDEALESTWRPENSSGKFYGPTRLREALYRSRNLVSIRVLQSIGINTAINTLEKFGFNKSALPRDLSLSLGSHSVTPLEIATAYSVFANGGYRIEPFLIDRIETNDGFALYKANPKIACNDCQQDIDNDSNSSTKQRNTRQKSRQNNISSDQLTAQDYTQLNQPYPIEGDAFGLSFLTKYQLNMPIEQDQAIAEKILDDQVAYLIDSMLKDVIQRGTATKARALKRTDIGGKTGTTNGPVDAWFSGYSKNLVTTTWLGFDKSKPLGKREYGGSAALPIWIDYMSTALKKEPQTKTTQPQGLVSVRINPKTGKRAQINNLDAIFEIFREDNVPEIEEVADSLEINQKSDVTITEELF